MRERIVELLKELHKLDPGLARAASNDLIHGDALYSEQMEDMLRSLINVRRKRAA